MPNYDIAGYFLPRYVATGKHCVSSKEWRICGSPFSVILSGSEESGTE